MFPMVEYSFVAHALRDYLRGFVGPSELSYIDSPLASGEAFTSILASLHVAVEHGVALPELYVQHIFVLPGLSESESSALNECVKLLPRFETAA